jgi:hypothetical protein
MLSYILGTCLSERHKLQYVSMLEGAASHSCYLFLALVIVQEIHMHTNEHLHTFGLELYGIQSTYKFCVADLY